MSGKKEIFQEVLTNPFSIEAFVRFSKEFLNGVDMVAPDRFVKEYSNFSYYVDGYYHIGNYVSDDNDKIAVFAVCLKKGETVERARSMQRNFVKPLLENSGCAAAIVSFYTNENPEKWRLSYIRLDYEFTKGKVTEKLTPAKRYSYLVGKDEPCHTAQQCLFPIFKDDDVKPGLDELEEAFSVERVTKEFFSLYCEKYHQLREYLESNEEFIQEANLRHFTSEQFAKKLLGQIVFLYFIQKKGWLGVEAIPTHLDEKAYKNAYFARGSKSREIISDLYSVQSDGIYRIDANKLIALSNEDEEFLAGIVKGKPWGTGPKDFMRKIFIGCEAKGLNYFDDYLEPLFYTGLNKNRGENGFYAPLHRRIPFLNGGLFEQLDNYEWENNHFDIPNSLFSNVNEKGRDADGILDIFDRYNFTMSEDEPMEREVAIDPEMLGKVFENLLDVKDRKSKGAFYTPREIVHYMCQESIINHLVTRTGIPEEDVRDFIVYGEIMRDSDMSKDVREGKSEMLIPKTIYDQKNNINKLSEIDLALSEIKVCDPAVGSGAFPLGMLNEIVRIRNNLTSYLAINMNSFEKLNFIAYGRKPYDLKVNTIKNCIFACDIEPSAVDIAKLRLWLSIVVDDELVENTSDGQFDEHTKPRQLPNLDCNILCGNSLVDEFKGAKLINKSELLNNLGKYYQTNLYQSGFDKMLTELIALQDKLFFTKEHLEKEEIKKQISEIYNQIIINQINDNPELVQDYLNSLKLPSSPFILWQLYFPQVFTKNGGFDVVIGNPPYVGESGHKEIFREVANTDFGKDFYQGKMDFFYFFFHKGLNILNSKGEIALITTNYYLTATGARTLRKDFQDRTFIRKLINFNELKVFESALGQHNMITFLSKNKDNNISCESIYCNRTGVANSNEIKAVLTGGLEGLEIYKLDQDNIFDGKECYIRQMGVKSSTDNGIVGSIIDKMAKQKIKIADLLDVNQGVVSGCDTVANRNINLIPTSSNKIKDDGIYVFDLKNQRDVQVITGLGNGKKLLRDFYKNSDINRYFCSCEATKKLIYFQDGLDEEEFPDIKEHLEKFKPLLENRLITYNEHYHWTALHRSRKEKIFVGPKIVAPYRTKINSFAYNEVEWFCRSDCYVLTPKIDNVDLFFVLGLLNSKLNYIWLYNRGKRKGEILELMQVPLSEIPIVSIKKELQKEISNLAKDITNKKRDNEDTKELESRIDAIIYSAYDLTEEEIEYVEKTVN